MMGAAMLKGHQFVQSLWALYRLLVSSIMWESQAQPLLMYSKNTFCQGVCNDGGSHVETSSICAVPLLWTLYRLVVSSITWGSQAQKKHVQFCKHRKLASVSIKGKSPAKGS